jgi:hypothetical protein
MTWLIDHAHGKAAFGDVELRDLPQAIDQLSERERTYVHRAGAGRLARQW